MDLKYYFDFEKCWDEIIGGYKDDDVFDDNMLEDIEDKRIASFIKNQIQLYPDECEISGNNILFCFSLEYATANELNNHNECITISIGYDWHNEDFTHYGKQ